MEDKNKSNLIHADFRTEEKFQPKKPVNFSPNQSNPIFNKLFKLTHTELSKNGEDYKSFSKFKPEDLR